MGDVFNQELLAASVRLATPLLLAALGGLLAWRAGVINLAMEGFLLIGALSAALGTIWTDGSLPLALGIAVLVSLLTAMVLGAAIVYIGADQVVSGIAFNIFALGITTFIATLVARGQGGSGLQVPLIKNVAIPVLSDLPLVGDALFNQSPFTYATVLLAFTLAFVLYRTGLGVTLRAVGEHARAADTAGIAVTRVRYCAFLFSCVCAGLAGAFLSVGYVGSFITNISQGRGYIAIAIIILGQWRPLGTLAAAAVFGVAQALAVRWTGNTLALPIEAVQALPYVLALVVVAVVGKAKGPAEEGRHYQRAG
jgi:general nucleoside transport system permease protein